MFKIIVKVIVGIAPFLYLLLINEEIMATGYYQKDRFPYFTVLIIIMLLMRTEIHLLEVKLIRTIRHFIIQKTFSNIFYYY